jgi:hypothetical protein
MKLNEIYLSDSHNIELTVALPIYNRKKIRMKKRSNLDFSYINISRCVHLTTI